MKKPKSRFPFSDEVRYEVDTNYIGKPFTVFDFQQIADKYEITIKPLTNIFRTLAHEGKLLIVGKQKNPHGGGLTKRYMLVSGETISTDRKPKKSDQQLREEATLRDLNSVNAANSLTAALDRMTRMVRV